MIELYTLIALITFIVFLAWGVISPGKSLRKLSEDEFAEEAVKQYLYLIFAAIVFPITVPLFIYALLLKWRIKK